MKVWTNDIDCWSQTVIWRQSKPTSETATICVCGGDVDWLRWQTTGRDPAIHTCFTASHICQKCLSHRLHGVTGVTHLQSKGRNIWTLVTAHVWASAARAAGHGHVIRWRIEPRRDVLLACRHSVMPADRKFPVFTCQPVLVPDDCRETVSSTIVALNCEYRTSSNLEIFASKSWEVWETQATICLSVCLGVC